MAEQEIGSYLVFYAVICVCLGASYMKVKSAEGVTVTTKEFKTFQNGFLTAHGMIFLGDLLCLASFYPTFASIGCNIEQITKLYITTTISKTVFGLLTDIIDFGTRKDKCVLSAALYSFSLFLLFCDDHFDMLIMSRVVYGAGSALHHTAFENYINYQHEILGFPDDWLHFTYVMRLICSCLELWLLLFTAVALGSPILLPSCSIIISCTSIAQHHHTNNNSSSNPNQPLNQLIQVQRYDTWHGPHGGFIRNDRSNSLLLRFPRHSISMLSPICYHRYIHWYRMGPRHVITPLHVGWVLIQCQTGNRDS